MDAPADSERGDTLLEVLVAVVIAGLTVTAIIGGLLLAVQYSDVHRKQASAGSYVKDYAEAVVGAAGTGYTTCASPSAYNPSGTVKYTNPSGFTATTVQVRVWNGTAWVASGSGCSDLGLQQVTVQVASNDGRATEQLVLVLRKPCATGSACT